MYHKKNLFKLITALSLIIFNSTLHAWTLTDILIYGINKNGDKNTIPAKKGEFDPHKDILYLPPVDYHDFIKSINNMSITRDPHVRKYIYLYLTLGREFVKKSIERYHIYEDILIESYGRNMDVPIEIMLLPLLESGFNPFAVSRSKATGMWQFLLNTSRPLGLVSNRWIDERRNIEKSTEAAIRHLKYLYNKFNSWELALTAYNGGKGLVERALKKSGAENIRDLRASGELTEEAGQFLPRFTALLIIFKNQDLFGIKDEINLPKKIKTEIISLKFPVKLQHISKYSGTGINLIKKYNPELNGDMTPPNVNSYSLRLPVEGKTLLEKNLNSLYKYKITMVKTHVVKSGETLTLIAGKYKILPKELVHFNTIINPNIIKPGQIINIPY